MKIETEAINLALKGHQTAALDWNLRALLSDLHIWAERFAVEFKLDIPTPALAVARLRSYFGHFRPGRNDWGLKHEVAIDRTHALHSEYWQVLGTLLHELLHVWQDVFGSPPSRTSKNYHNRELRARAALLGLVIDRYGHTAYEPENS
jgi:hypothetical protein